MRKRSADFQQLDLFHPPRVTPEWKSLPAEVREEVVKLLARMFQNRIHQQIEKREEEIVNE